MTLLNSIIALQSGLKFFVRRLGPSEVADVRLAFSLSLCLWSCFLHAWTFNMSFNFISIEKQVGENLLAFLPYSLSFI